MSRFCPPTASVRRLAVSLGLALALSAPAQGVTITMDYSLDTGGFFDTGTANGLAATNRMNEAAAFFSNLLTDTLDAITPGGSNTWTITYTNPTTGAADSMVDITLGADELIIFAGARTIAGSTLGIGGFGGFSASGFAPFLNSVQTRGETGVGTTDFAPWGGTVAFDSSATWNFGAGLPGGGENDFFSVALHELGHVLGLGTANSWAAMVVGDGSCTNSFAFSGTASVASNGGNVCLDDDQAHWENGTMSGGFEAAMDPSIPIGTRKLFTPVDIAALDDVGWDIPEPGTVLLLAAALAVAAQRRRRAA